MFTPQQLQQITFDKAVFGGYDMESVDEILEPLIDDYEALYRENATLKSKMRVLVEKLEEYRRNEGSVKEALRAAQRTCDAMIREAEKKCLDMLKAAKAQGGVEPAGAPAPAPVVAGPVVDVPAVERLRTAALEQVAQMETQLRAMETALAQMKAHAQQELPMTAAPAAPAAPAGGDAEEEVAREIAENLERIVGTTEDAAPVSPRPAPVTPSGTTGRFTDLGQQFGKNYDPTKR